MAKGTKNVMDDDISIGISESYQINPYIYKCKFDKI